MFIFRLNKDTRVADRGAIYSRERELLSFHTVGQDDSMTNRPRIIYVVHDFPPEVTAGTELHTLWLAEELSNDYEIFIFTRTHDPSLQEYAIRDEELQGLKIRRVKFTNKDWAHPADFYLNSRIGDIFASYIDEIHPALIHIHHTVGLSATVIEVAADRRIPTILNLRDFHYMCQRTHLLDASGKLCNGPLDGMKCAECIQADSNPYIPKDLGSFYSRPIFEQGGIDRAEYMRTLLLLPDLIICPSDFLKTKFVEFGVPASKIKVSPDGVKLEGIKRQRHERKKEKIVFGFIGNIAYHKGPHILIEAFEGLDQSKVELQIFGAGDAALIERLRTRCQGLNVRFMGGYSHDQLPKILSNLDIIVHPSICHESYSIVVREGLAAGIPVIVSDIQAQRDAVRDGVDGLHFRAGDSEDLRSKMNLLVEKRNILPELEEGTLQVRDVDDQAREFVTIYKEFKYNVNREDSNREILVKLETLRQPIILWRRFVEELRKRDELNAKLIDRVQSLEVTLREKDACIKEFTEMASRLQGRVDAMESSIVWTLYRQYSRLESKLLPQGSSLRRLYLAALEALRRRTIGPPGEFRELSGLFLFGPSILNDSIRSAADSWLARFQRRPKFSILMPTYNSNPVWLEEAISSVVNQLYPSWELCIVDDGSSAKSHFQTIERFARKDNRIRTKFLQRNLGVAGALNQALEMATGEFVGFLDHDDELTLDALLENAKAINRLPGDLYYSDEAYADEHGNIFDLIFRPDFSPDFLLSHQYIVHFCLFRTDIAKEVRFREEFLTSQDYDFILRFIAKTRNVHHIPKVLYKWRNIPDPSRTSYRYRDRVTELGIKALNDYATLMNIDAKVEPTRFFNYYRFRRAVDNRERVSIIILVKNRYGLLRNCIRSIEEKTIYRNYEIVVVDNGSDDPRTVEYLRTLPYKVIRHDAPYNFSELNNVGASHSAGEHLLFLNNDTQIVNSDWLSSMLEHSQRQEVGAVGTKLLFPDGRIQHAGIVLGLFGVCEHIHKFDDARLSGYLGALTSVRNYSAVTAACVMIRRSVFDEVGGFDERLAVNYNDVDLCLRIRKQGYLIVYTPYAEIIHLEHATRRTVGEVRAEAFPEDTKLFLERWGETIRKGDPYYNPNLDLFSWVPQPDLRPIRILRLVYQNRRDLQNAFPEAARGNYSRLVQWAAKEAVKEQSALRGYADWYSRMRGV